MREIAQSTGLSRTYIYGLMSDPHGRGVDARRLRCTKQCDECGGPCHSRGSDRCQQCFIAAYAVFVRIRHIEAIRLWAELYGAPPVAQDWSATAARVNPERWARWDRFDWPGLRAVQDVFGSWNAAIEAAGFMPNKPGRHRRGARLGDDPDVRRDAAERFVAGEDVERIASEVGTVPLTVRIWARELGLYEPRPRRVRRPDAPSPRRHSVGHETRWIVWERDDFRCRECGSRRYLAVDHIHPVALGGTDELSNLQTLCRPCNSRKWATA